MCSGAYDMIRYKKYKEANKIIKKINNNPDKYLIIHYSCESFMDKPNGGTPRITSIAVRYFTSAQTKSFSIHKVAEQQHISFDEIEKNYDKCEKLMLKNFFDFVSKNMNFYWLHWNMRDENYGFYAIENRYKVLGGKATCVPDDKKLDVARLFVDRYGKNYIENPKIVNLVEKNKMTHMDFLKGKQEAEAFNDKEYIKLHKSTLRKVDLFACMLVSSAENTLKTNATWKEIYGISPQGIYEALNGKLWFNIILGIIVLFMGAIMGAILGKII